MILSFFKKAEREKNRIIIPKIMIDKFGNEFYLRANTETGVMILKPVKKGE